MTIVCLDLEGVLIPEIWQEISQHTGITELRRTTRDVPNYNRLMRGRLSLLAEHNIKIDAIHNIISRIKPLDGAQDFLNTLRSRYQTIILSDTFVEFIKPLMAALGWPTIFCNNLCIDNNGFIVDYRIRQHDGKKKVISALHKLGFATFAAGDSYNDLRMIRKATHGALFRAPQRIQNAYRHFACYTEYEQLLEKITSVAQ